MADTLLGNFRASRHRNVFVMMRYRDDPKFIEIDRTIRTTLEQYGLVARLARDGAFDDDLWSNVVTYMSGSEYGIAVFEELEERDYNPNISMELGYMYALERRCLLLKDRRMPTLPTDICGRIYRDFDPYNLETSIRQQVTHWCVKDLGFEPADVRDTRPPSSLEKFIADHVDTSDFESPLSWEDHARQLISYFADGETTYIIWNSKKQRLYKYYQYGVSWDGPLPLAPDEEERVAERVQFKK